MTRVNKTLLQDTFIESISPGEGIEIDFTNPTNPVISSSIEDVDVTEQLQTYWMPSNLELSEISTIPLLIGMSEGNGLFDGFNSLTYVDLANSTVDTTQTGVLSPIVPPVTVSFSHTAKNFNFLNWSNVANRLLISHTVISTSGNRVRLRLIGPTDGTSLIFTNLAIGPGTNQNFTSTPVILTVGGNQSFTLASGTTVYTDWVEYNLDEAVSQVIAFHNPSPNGSMRCVNASPPSTQVWYNKLATTQETTTLSVTGYATSQNYSYPLIEAIEVRNGDNANINAVSQVINLQESPDWCRVVSIVNKDQAVLNSQLIFRVSKNDGTNYQDLNIGEIFTRSDGSVYLDSGIVDISALATGLQAKWRVSYSGTRAPSIKAIGVVFGKNQ